MWVGEIFWEIGGGDGGEEGGIGGGGGEMMGMRARGMRGGEVVVAGD